jgi:Fe-S-cluster containining protein
MLEAPPRLSTCRCGDCCKGLIIETSLEDAVREPLIALRGSPLYLPAELTKSGRQELEGYLLNGTSGCMFLDAATNHCTIYETRPLCCRLFDCDEHCGRKEVQD